MARWQDYVLRDTRANQPAANSVAIGTIYYVTDEAATERSDGSSWEDISDAGSGISETLIDAAGDLIVGIADDTPARLPVGTDGQVLTADSGETEGMAWVDPSVYPTGTSFPGGPSTNDIFYRTDLKGFFVYDGTRWLSVTKYVLPLPPYRVIPSTGFTATNSMAMAALPLFSPEYGFWLERWEYVSYINPTVNGSNYWDVLLVKRSTGNVDSTLSTVTTSADTGNVVTKHGADIGAAWDTTHPIVGVNILKVANPSGLILFGGQVIGRMIAT
jgi:hypothetical protein